MRLSKDKVLARRRRRYGRATPVLLQRKSVCYRHSVTSCDARLRMLDYQASWPEENWSIWNEMIETNIKVSRTVKETDDWVLKRCGFNRSLLSSMKIRKLQYFGHVMRKHYLGINLIVLLTINRHVAKSTTITSAVDSASCWYVLTSKLFVYLQ